VLELAEIDQPQPPGFELRRTAGALRDSGKFIARWKRSRTAALQNALRLKSASRHPRRDEAKLDSMLVLSG
jgi:hypothetical protein